MSKRYPGGVISKTPPTIVPPVAGEGGSASGVWTLADVIENQLAGAWPKPVVIRELYSWGENDVGNIGDNTIINKSSPVQVGALTNWKSVGGFGTKSNGIESGKLYGWGDNTDGQAGLTVSGSYTSSPVQIGSLTTWNKIVDGVNAGGAIKSDGTLWMWGLNSSGQLGTNNTISRSSPVQLGSETNWVKGCGGTNWTAILNSNGDLFTFGSGGSGRTGHGDTVNTSSPIQVGASGEWADVSAGTVHCVALKKDGTLWAWGNNEFGAIGDGTGTTANNRSSPVQIGALTNWALVNGANEFSQAVKNDGTLWAWGKNFGLLGDGGTAHRSSPVQVGALTDWSTEQNTLLRCNRNIAGAIKTDGTLWMWGPGNFGQLGTGNTDSVSSPVQVGAINTWLTIAGSAYVVKATRS